MSVTNIPVPVPVPVPRTVGAVVAVPLDQKVVVLRGKGKRAAVVVGDATGPVVSTTPVPVPSGRKLVDVPLYHEAVLFLGIVNLTLAVVLTTPVPVPGSNELVDAPLYHDAVLLMEIGYLALVVALSQEDEVVMFADAVARAAVEFV